MMLEISVMLMYVAPHWGAWIEIALMLDCVMVRLVAPHWGAWIEIWFLRDGGWLLVGRTPLGCVD